MSIAVTMDTAGVLGVAAELRGVAQAATAHASCPAPPSLPAGELAALLGEASTLDAAVVRSASHRLDGVARHLTRTAAAATLADRWPW